MGQSYDILRIIQDFTGSCISYLIKSIGDDYRVLSYDGSIGQNDILLAQFNDEIAPLKKKTNVKIQKLPSYLALTNKYALNSFHIIKYEDDTFLILFAKDKNVFTKKIIEIIDKLIASFSGNIIPDKPADAVGDKHLQELEKSEEKFRMLVDTANDFIFILNGFGYFSMVNKNGALALGYQPGEMIGKHFLEFIEPDDAGKIAEAFQRIIGTDDVTVFETNFITKMSKRAAIEIHARPLKTDGEITGMISIGRDITTRIKDQAKLKELNQKLIEANRIISIERERAKNKITVLEELNKLKGEFISNISHELRTPLASIVGFAETIVSDTELTKPVIIDFTNVILTEGKRLAKIINEILDFSKLESGEEELRKSTFDIVEAIQSVVEVFKQQIADKNITLSTQFPDKGLSLKADKERITKVIYNLLSNAIKFNNSGGRIFILAHEEENEIEFSISDTGIGIAEKDIPGLFQKFSKISRPGVQIPGAGFGLVTVKQIIDLHKGLIKVTSELNKGTTIIVRLPK